MLQAKEPAGIMKRQYKGSEISGKWRSSLQMAERLGGKMTVEGISRKTRDVICKEKNHVLHTKVIKQFCR